MIKLITDAAQANSQIMTDIPPLVLFRKLGDATKEFELTCFIADVDLTGQVGSDLLLAIDNALRVQGLGEIIHKTVIVPQADAVKG